MTRMKTPSLEFSLAPVDNRKLALLCGSLDENLRQIEITLEVSIARRGEKFSISGEREKIDLAAKAVNRFYARASRSLSVQEIQLGLLELSRARVAGEVAGVRSPRTQNTVVEDPENAPDNIALHTRRPDLRARTDRQAQYIRQSLLTVRSTTWPYTLLTQYLSASPSIRPDLFHRQIKSARVAHDIKRRPEVRMRKPGV